MQQIILLEIISKVSWCEIRTLAKHSCVKTSSVNLEPTIEGEWDFSTYGLF